MVDFDKLEEITKRIREQIEAAPPEERNALIVKAIEFYNEQARLARQALKG